MNGLSYLKRKWPNTALQTNTPGCHGACFLRATRGFGFGRAALRFTRWHAPRQPGVSLSLGSFGDCSRLP